MDRPVRIVGHGLAGCVLALSFYRKNVPVKIYGISKPGEASMASSGLITPVTGRKYVKSWMIDDLLSAAIDFYDWTASLFSDHFFYPVEIIRFLSNPEALKAWEKRLDDPAYKDFISQKRYEELDFAERPYGVLTGGYRLDTPAWLAAARSFLKTRNMLIEREYTPHENSGDDIVIYATGATGHLKSTGIIPNKGEALLARIPGWKYPAIVKEQVFFIPLAHDDLFWIGSYYEPWPGEPGASLAGKKLLMQALEEVFQSSFTIIDHLAGVRPTVTDRRPIVGLLKHHPANQFIFNGMGTKGTSLAPYWANHLVDHLLFSAPLSKAVSPARFENQLSG